MTLKELVSQIAKLEGKNHEASVGDIREILAILADLEAEGWGVCQLLARMAAKRASK